MKVHIIAIGWFVGILTVLAFFGWLVHITHGYALVGVVVLLLLALLYSAILELVRERIRYK